MIRSLAARLPKYLKAFAIRIDRGPIDSIDSLNEFLTTRSAYIAQTSLYGYLKTRMGTRFRVMFEDDVFSASIRAATAKIFASCLADLTVYAVAKANHGERLGQDEARALALHCFKSALERGLADVNAPMDHPKSLADFDRRISLTNWERAAQGENSFAGSGTDLLLHAPVIDEFKELDREIVTNSIRFRWNDVRVQLKKRLNGAPVCDDWQTRGD
ncbi:MAG: hypothetical protein ACTSY1_03640 [Alphaproteobacteria bacterium]